MPLEVSYITEQRVPQKALLNSETNNLNKYMGITDLDKIPGVDTFNSAITDIANDGKLKSQKAINILMTFGLGATAFFTGKRITKSILNSICHNTNYLDTAADKLKMGLEYCKKSINKFNPKSGNRISQGIKKIICNIPSKIKKYASTGVYKDIEKERYAKLIKTDVNNLNANDLKRFDIKFSNTIAKNGLVKSISSLLGTIFGIQTFVEVGADKNKNGVPDLFEQKSYKEILETAQPNFDKQIIDIASKVNNEDKPDNQTTSE